MALKQPVKDAMRMFDSKKKWTIICQNRQKNPEENSKNWAEKLDPDSSTNSYKNAATYLELRPIINASSKQWIESFLNEGGVSNLLASGAKLREDSQYEEVLLASLNCLNSIMNNEIGIDYVLNNEDSILKLTQWFNCNNGKVQSAILRLLSVVAVLGNVKVILEGFNQQKESVRPRMSEVVKSLKEGKDVDTKVPFSHFIVIILHIS